MKITENKKRHKRETWILTEVCIETQKKQEA